MRTADSAEAQRSQVLTTYIQRMLSRRSVTTPYTQEQTMQWLAWLARQMTHHNQTEFYLERMQPNWLADLRSRQRHRSTVIRLIYGLTYMVVAGLFGWLRGGQGESGGGIGKGLLGWLGAGPDNSVLGWMAPGLGSGIGGGGTVGLMFAIVAALIGVLVSIASTEPRSAEAGWSWAHLGRSLMTGLLNGLKAGMLVGGFAGLLFGRSGGLLVGLSHGLAYGLFSGLVIGLLSGLAFGLVGRLAGWWILGTGFALVFSVIFALNFWNVYGGTACIEHMALRLRLWRAGSLPWNVLPFLDYAAERILLRKVGGSYMFVHRLLQEHFATLDTVAASDEDVAQPPSF